MSVTPARSRARNIDLGSRPEEKPVSKVTPSMRALAASVYSHNKAMNAEKSAHDKDRKALFGEMINANVKSFDMTAMGDDGKIVLDVEIGAPVSEKMDVRKLFEYLGCDTSTIKGKEALQRFFDTITATKGSVEELHGKGMVARIAYPHVGDQNVSVKPKKS